ncbi:MAG: citrate/2-methylcitrate synthase, partial [Gammaproteobacteria bacterium]
MNDRLQSMNHAVLTVEGESHTLPTCIGIEGDKAIDISQLRKQTGYITLDEGYGNTGACESAITFIDGENGVLRYRGYPIEELAEHSRFIEVAYLLLYGELPDESQLNHFSTCLNESSIIHEDMHHFFNGFPHGSHPMGILATMVASLSAFYPVPDQLDESSEIQIVANLVSQVRT